MVAIAGSIAWSGSARTLDPIHAMLAALKGTGARVVREPGGAALGCVGAEGEALEDVGEVVVERLPLQAVVDARLDNRGWLLEALDLPPDTRDSIIVAAAYRRWGTAFPSRLRGDFAIVIWDPDARQFVAARDPFGIRPLCYASIDGKTLIASDPEQILATGAVEPIPDDVSVVAFLHWQVAGHERSFFRDIRRVPGGHVLVVGASTVRLADYRNVQIPTVAFRTREDMWTELRDELTRSVRARLRSSGPVVMQLSGGVDSSSIACLADGAWTSDAGLCPSLRAVSAVHTGFPSDESRFIRAVANQVRFPVETWEGIGTNIRELEEVPVWAPGARYVMTGGTEGDVEIARRIGAHVMLSGVGGDQFGTPEGAIEDAVREHRWSDALGFLLNEPGVTPRSVLRKALSAAKSLSPPWLQSLHSSRRTEEQRPKWLAPWAQALDDEQANEPSALPSVGGHLQRTRWKGLLHPRLVGLIELGQQHSLRWGVERRYPFLDWDLVMFVLAIPAELWPAPWPQERLHREALQDVLPGLVARRRTKAMFASTMAHRVRAQMGSIRDLLGASPWLSERYIDRSAIQREIRALLKAPNPTFATTWAVWATACVEAWLRVLSDYNPTRGGGD